jgi:hypothetical protein
MRGNIRTGHSQLATTLKKSRKQFKEATRGTHRARRTCRRRATSLAFLPIQARLLRWISNPKASIIPWGAKVSADEHRRTREWTVACLNFSPFFNQRIYRGRGERKEGSAFFFRRRDEAGGGTRKRATWAADMGFVRPPGARGVTAVNYCHRTQRTQRGLGKKNLFTDIKISDSVTPYRSLLCTVHCYNISWYCLKKKWLSLFRYICILNIFILTSWVNYSLVPI